MKPRILNLTPLGQGADGNPRYEFHTSFPSRGVRAVGEPVDTPEAAMAIALKEARAYEAADIFGNMAVVLGVTQENGKFRGVICTYHSNS